MAASETFTKDYVLLKSEYNKGEEGRQFNDVRQSAIQRGLRPTGDVKFVGAEGYGAVSVRLTYTVPVVLAEEAETFKEKHAYVSPTDQAAFEAFAGDAADEPTGDKAETKGVGDLKSSVTVKDPTSTPERPTDPDAPAGSTEQAASTGSKTATRRKKEGDA